MTSTWVPPTLSQSLEIGEHTLPQLTRWNLASSPIPPHKKAHTIFSIQFATPAGQGNKDNKYIGGLERVLFINVILLMSSKFFFILSIRLSTPFQIAFTLQTAPNGRPRYFMVKEDILQPKILAKLRILLSESTRTNLDYARLTFRLETASKQIKEPSAIEVPRIIIIYWQIFNRTSPMFSSVSGFTSALISPSFKGWKQKDLIMEKSKFKLDLKQSLLTKVVHGGFPFQLGVKLTRADYLIYPQYQSSI